MPPNIITDLWLPFVVAMGVSVALAFVFAHFGKTPPGEPSRDAMSRGLTATVAVAAGVTALHLMNFGRPAWPPPSLTQRLLLVIALAGIAGVLASMWNRWILTGIAAFLGVLAVLAIAVWPMCFTSEGGISTRTLLMIAGLALLATCSIVSLADIERRGHPFAAAVILAGCGWAVGAALLGSGNMVLGQFGFAVGATVLALLLAMILMQRRRTRIGVGGAATGFAMLAGLLLAGNRYGELRLVPAFLFALPAPLAAIAVRALSRLNRPRLAGVIAVIIAALTAGVAGGLAIDLPQENEPSGQEEGYARLEPTESHRILRAATW
jgi:hypothetical protein